MNYLATGSVSRDSNCVHWELEKPPDTLLLGWGGTMGAFCFFGLFSYLADWLPIRVVGFICVVYLGVFAVNLLRATFGKQRAFVIRTGNALTFDLGFPYQALGRETPKALKVREMFFLKSRTSIMVEEVLSVMTHTFHNEASLRLCLQDSKSLLIAEGLTVDIEKLANSIRGLVSRSGTEGDSRTAHSTPLSPEFNAVKYFALPISEKSAYSRSISLKSMHSR